LAGVGLGRISEKWPDFGFAGTGAGAEIRYNPTRRNIAWTSVTKNSMMMIYDDDDDDDDDDDAY